MRRVRGSLSLSLAVLAAAELSYNPAGQAQQPPPAQGEPQVDVQGGAVAPGQPPPPGPEQPPGPPGPPPPYGQAPYGQSPYGQPPPNGPFVTLRATSPKARLQIQTQLKWQDVCLAPCNIAVNPAGVYRVGGGSIRASDEFSMPRAAGPVVIDAQVGSKVKHIVGIGMIVVGIVDIALGAIYFAGAESLADSSGNTTGQGKEYFQTIGVVGVVTGLVLLAIGIPFSTSRTRVTVR